MPIIVNFKNPFLPRYFLSNRFLQRVHDQGRGFLSFDVQKEHDITFAASETEDQSCFHRSGLKLQH